MISFFFPPNDRERSKESEEEKKLLLMLGMMGRINRKKRISSISPLDLSIPFEGRKVEGGEREVSPHHLLLFFHTQNVIDSRLEVNHENRAF